MNRKLRDRSINLDYILAGKRNKEESPESQNNVSASEDKEQIPLRETTQKIREESTKKNSEQSTLKKKGRYFEKSVPAEDKVKFMTYLNPEIYKKFTHIFIDVRADARGITKKQLSQSEMVEVLILFAEESSKGNYEKLTELAQEIIEKR